MLVVAIIDLDDFNEQSLEDPILLAMRRHIEMGVPSGKVITEVILTLSKQKVEIFNELVNAVNLQTRPAIFIKEGKLIKKEGKDDE